MSKCTNCGLCCYLNDKPCKYLVFMPDGTTRCSIYEKRLGTSLGDGYVCVSIMSDPCLYPGCPYNEDKVRDTLNFTRNNGKY